MRKNQHVTPHTDGGWQVKSEVSNKATVRTSTQSQATSIAKSIAKNQQSELIIHGKDGRIRQKESYGNDPFLPRG